MLKRLCAIRLRLLLDALTGSGRHRRGMRVLYGFLLLYCVVVFGGLFGLLFWALRPLAEAGLSWLYFALAGILSAGLAFAGSVRFMAENRSLQGLSSLAAFPLTVRENGGVRTTAAPAELETLDPSLIFPDARREAVLSANLYELREENGRWTLGPEGGPNIMFQRDETGTGFRVTEVN